MWRAYSSIVPTSTSHSDIVALTAQGFEQRCALIAQPWVLDATRRVGEHAQAVHDATGEVAVAERGSHGEGRQRAGAVGQPLRRLLAGDDVHDALPGRDREQ